MCIWCVEQGWTRDRDSLKMLVLSERPMSVSVSSGMTSPLYNRVVLLELDNVS
jgi:hypothetical protein